ncbi:MAG: hypothetical protein RLZZ299_1280 [Pseudomonadota bacterium]
MSRWMVNARGEQRSAENMDELRRLAREGVIEAGDLLQPPGARDWLYVAEVPELAGDVRAPVAAPTPASGRGGSVLAAVMGVAAIAVWAWAISVRASIPAEGSVRLRGGADGLKDEQALVTVEGAQLTAEPGAGTPVATLGRADVVTLLDKRGLSWQVRAGETTGWIDAAKIIPGWYFGDEKVYAVHNPLFNPGQYVTVANGGATSGPESPAGTANFTFLLSNTSTYEMNGLKLGITLKDPAGAVLETRELAIEGSVPAGANTMVGTLKPSKTAPPTEGSVMTNAAYEKVLLTDTKASDRWMDGAQLPIPAGADLRRGVKIEVKVLDVRPVRSGA